MAQATSGGDGPTVWTIGYAGRQVREFVANLQEAGVGLVVDVREHAWSRRAGFAGKALAGTRRLHHHPPLITEGH